MSTTNPENGTVTTYDSAHHVTGRTDAQNQLTQYSYDSYGRLTQIIYPSHPSQTINYSCDYSPAGYYSGSSWGRLTQVTFQAGLKPVNFTYMYASMEIQSTISLPLAWCHT